MSNSDQKPSTELRDVLLTQGAVMPDNIMTRGATTEDCYCCVDCGRQLVRKDLVFLAEDQKPPQRCGGCWIKAGRPEGNQ